MAQSFPTDSPLRRPRCLHLSSRCLTEPDHLQGLVEKSLYLNLSYPSPHLDAILDLPGAGADPLHPGDRPLHTGGVDHPHLGAIGPDPHPLHLLADAPLLHLAQGGGRDQHPHQGGGLLPGEVHLGALVLNSVSGRLTQKMRRRKGGRRREMRKRRKRTRKRQKNLSRRIQRLR